MIQLWFVSRALGLVALLLLSLVIALGALHNTTLTQSTGETVPRFVLVALHRNLSLITVAFVLLHVVTVLVTPYLQLRWFDALVPGTARFSPLAAALGVVSFDLLLAIIVTSMLRSKLSRRVWFVVHWTSYLCFPVAVAHAVVNASFRGMTWWTLVVPLIGIGVVVAALVYRRRARRRAPLPLQERGRVSEVARAESVRRVRAETPAGGIPLPPPAAPEPDPEPDGATTTVLGGRADGPGSTPPRVVPLTARRRDEVLDAPTERMRPPGS